MRPLVLLLSLVFSLASCRSAKPLPTVPGQSPSDALVAQGQRELREGRTDEALALYRKALAADPSSPNAMRALVEGHFRTGRIALIIRELEERVAAQETDDLAHYGLGMAYFARSADAEGKAVAHLRRATELRPRVAEYPFRLGVVHLEAERYPEAVESLKKSRELEPGQPRHYVPLALALSRTGDRKGAVDALRAILSLNPERRDIETAKKVMARLNDTFREFPKAVEGDFQRGIDLMDRADSPQQAIVAFEEILEKFPDLAVVHAALGLCYQRIEDAGRAMDEYHRALELAPEDGRNHGYVADLYYSRERFDKAVESYRAAVERDPLNDHGYDRLGQIALQRGDAPEAARWLKLLTVVRPDDPAARQSYGLALLAQKEFGAAEREFNSILERDPRNTEALLRLGLLNMEWQSAEKDPGLKASYGEKAARYFEQVLDLQPQNVLAARMLKSLKP